MSSSSPRSSSEVNENLLAAAPAVSTVQGTGVRGKGSRRIFRLVVVYSVLAILLYLALRTAPFIEIRNTLRQLEFSQLAILFAINALVILCMTARWWVIVRAENTAVPFLPLIRYRLSVFGLSYFTPGPQVGGEPLQVLYLQRNHGISFARATSAVIMDKLLEFLANFILIGIGLTAAVRVGMISGNGTQALGSLSLIPTAVILAWPVIHLVLLYRGRYPISSLLRSGASILGNPNWVRLIIVAERMAAAFARRRLKVLLLALGFSMLAWAGMAAEYVLMASFLNANLSLDQTLAALTAALFAFLLPLPGGLGALEASQVYALTSMGYAPAIGISLSLIMRGRDILNGGIGLLLAGKFIREIHP
ncbi:MAG TPA: lysylphosphatidylglycerol synthase transmembrane domain-containing protein [Anaerolineales bacterium]|nr:lysylphosphatidylglycerol synthase transmembrane domain-containing protein [Anaerolineales bacterium]